MTSKANKALRKAKTMTYAEQQKRNATARREVQKELSNAIKNRVERGTVVTSTGAWIAFEIEYITFNLTTGPKHSTKITIKGHTDWSVNYAASTALYEWGYTR